MLQSLCYTVYSYLSTDYFGTRKIIFGNNMNTIEMHLMVSYSIHVIVEYNQAGSEIICRQIVAINLALLFTPNDDNKSKYC